MKSMSSIIVACVTVMLTVFGSVFGAVDYNELLPNPSFDTDASGWWLSQDSGGHVTGSRDASTWDTAPAGYKIECINSGTSIYSVQLNTTHLSITNGQKYRLIFRVKGTSPFTIPAVRLMKSASPWNDYCDFHTDWSVQVCDTWSIYTIEYIANVTATDARISFLLGSVLPAGETFYVDSVSFRAVMEDQLLVNPSFDTDTSGWWLHQDSGGDVTGSRDTSAYDTAPASYKIECTNPGTNTYSIQFNTNTLNITNVTRYRLRFRARSTVPFAIPAIRLMQSASPWNDYCDEHTDWSADISDTWSIYTIDYVANATASDARITFALGSVLPAGAIFHLDTVSFTAIEKPVMIQILGSSLTWSATLYKELEAIENAVRDLAGKGFSASWDASPGGWSNGLLERTVELTHCREMAERIHEYGMGVSMGVKWPVLLPNEPENSHATWVGEYLDPATGQFTYVKSDPDEMRNWDFGSDEAKTAFVSRLKTFLQEVGPFETFFIDEIILAVPGPDAHCKQISSYWASPTYSFQSLQSFRNYLAQKNYPFAAYAKFPVTTIAVPAGAACNMGLPAVPITFTNRDRLVADNNWPDSPLWQHWYAWREDLLASWVHEATQAAYEICGDLPKWQGCTVSYPEFWYQPALGPNLEKLGDLQYVDYLVAGYCSASQFDSVKQAAEAKNKKWGAIVQLCMYGSPDGINPDSIIQNFKNQVTAGSSVVLVYAGCNFNTAYSEPTASGLYYMPDQVVAWGECINWLQQGRGYLDFSALPSDPVQSIPGDANGDGMVDVGDLGILAANYGTTSGATWQQGDFNGDGAVDVGDLGILAAHYGEGVSGAVDFDADYAKAFGTTVTDEDSDVDDAGGAVCSGLGLTLIAGLALMGLMLVKPDE